MDLSGRDSSSRDTMRWPIRRGDRLAERRHVTVVLRLVVDRRGQLVYGETVDGQSRSQSRFVGWRGLLRAVRASVDRQTSGTTF